MPLQLIKTIKKVLCLVIPLLVLGCAAIPKERLPETALKNLNELEKNLSNDVAQVQENSWDNFGDPQLSTLMVKVITTSPSLETAQARIHSAQSIANASRAILIPQVGFTGQVARQQLSQNYLYVPGMDPFTNYGYTVGTFAWNLDLWGKQKQMLKGANYRLMSAQAQFRMARLNLGATLASAYSEYDHAYKVYELVKKDLNLKEQLFNITNARYQAGTLDRVALDQMQIERKMAVVHLSQALTLVKQYQHQIAALAGEGPSWGERLNAPHMDLERAINNFPSEIPSDLIARRPDLQALLQNILASKAELSAAKLDYLPSFDIQGNVGFQSFGLDRLIDSSSRLFSIGPVLNLPIFDGGRIDANHLSKEASRNQAIAEYHETLLQALRQTADGVVSFRSSQEELKKISQATQIAERVFNASQSRKKSGMLSQEQLDLLEANLLRQQQVLADGQFRVYSALIGLGIALGGGYYAPEQKNTDRPISSSLSSNSKIQ